MSNSQMPSRTLDIGDSLKYLDSIKLRFLHAPHVYERFLDIMKCFKDSTLNTTGVIQSTCELFDGHPDLIMGLVTFLPTGYYIECDRHGSNRITVYTPERTMIRAASIGPGGSPARWSTVANTGQPHRRRGH